MLYILSFYNFFKFIFLSVNSVVYKNSLKNFVNFNSFLFFLLSKKIFKKKNIVN